MSLGKPVCYSLCDLYEHIRPYEIALEEEWIISKLGSIIREYLYNIIEFKVNCRMGIEDRLISCCASLLPLPSYSKRNNENKYCKTDFYVAFNIRRAQSWNEPNAVLFQYQKYSKSIISNTERGIQLDFLTKKQLKCMVMATFIKSKSIKKKTKKRRGSTQPIPKPPISSLNDLNPTWGYNSKSHKISRNTYINNRYHSNDNTPTTIAENVAILYPQDNLLWSYFKNKAKIIEQNAWLPIVSIWRQNDANIVYMLRGSNKSNKSNKIERKRNKKKKKTRSQSVQHHIRSHTPSAPIPEISPREKAIKKTAGKCKKYKIYKKPQYFEYTAPSSQRGKRSRPKLVKKTDNKSEDKMVRQSRSRSNVAPLDTKQKSKSCSFSPKRVKRGKSKSNYFGNNVSKQENEENNPVNPCKFYQITITEKEIVCSNLFDFPHINIQHELTWFDVGTRSLLLIINNNKDKTIELQIVKHNIFGNDNKSKSSINELTQSTTLSAEIEDEMIFKNITTGSRRKREKKRRKKSSIESNDKCSSRKQLKCKDKQRQMSASQLFHMKLQNESLRIPLIPPRGYSHLFRDCQCLKFFHHKQSNSYIFLLEKYEKKDRMNGNKENLEINIQSITNKRDILGKLLLKLKINFETTEIEQISFGIINEEDNDILMGQKYDIIGYDYNRSLLIVDTFYEPLSPLSCNPFSNKGVVKKIGFNQNSTKNLYNQYNKWFSFASKPFGKTKKRVITKKFAAFGLHEFVYHWKNIYDGTQIIKNHT